jgi:hypothetical protein
MNAAIPVAAAKQWHRLRSARGQIPAGRSVRSLHTGVVQPVSALHAKSNLAIRRMVAIRPICRRPRCIDPLASMQQGAGKSDHARQVTVHA